MSSRQPDTKAPTLPRVVRVLTSRPPLLRVVVGSRLHGFAHDASDHDEWVVYPEPRDPSPTVAAKHSHQVIETGEDEVTRDVTYVGLNTFLRYVANGSPQALEALFSPWSEIDQLGAFRFAYRINPHTARASYCRQMSDIVARRVAEPKLRRHAARLAVNLGTLLRYGWFNPCLSADERRLVLSVAEQSEGFVARLEDLAGMRLTHP